MSKGKYITSLYSILTGVRINLVGQLYGSELLALISLPTLKIRDLLKKYPVLGNIFKAHFILLFALMFSDFINGTPADDYLRGWASVAFSIISVIFLVRNFDKNPVNLFYFLLFYAISILVFGETIELTGLEENTNYYKGTIIGFLSPLVIAVSYLLATNKKQNLALGLLFIYVLVNFVFDARSEGVSFFIALLLLFFKYKKIVIKKNNMIVIMLFSFAISYGAYTIYVNKVLSGEIGGENAQQLKLATNPYNPFELLYYGRFTSFVALEAVKDKPIFGYGSWAKDKTGKFNWITFKVLGNDATALGTIPAHSVLLAAWVWAGIFGFLAVLYIYIRLIKFYIKIYKYDNTVGILTLITPLFIGVLWNFLFSPFGHFRQTIPQIEAILIVYSTMVERNRNRIS